MLLSDGHVRALALDAASYARHPLHHEERTWVEKNCYVDIWLEVIHALGCDPMAILPFVVAIDFEGDQWTFFKPPHNELRELYGIDVQELNAWRPLIDHAHEHLGAGKLIATESDSWWLPDTAGTDYRRQHVKTTIVLNEVNAPARRLGYFHNAAYHVLEGEDFEQIFRLGTHDPAFLPLFAEVVRVERVVSRPRAELASASRALLARHLARRPADNPVVRFQRRFERDLPWLTERGLEHYHAWAFATLRQLGSALELASLYVGWLEDAALAEAAASFAQASAAAKTFILKAARAINARRRLDASGLFDEMAGGWQRGMDALAARAP